MSEIVMNEEAMCKLRSTITLGFLIEEAMRKVFVNAESMCTIFFCTRKTKLPDAGSFSRTILFELYFASLFGPPGALAGGRQPALSAISALRLRAEGGQ